MSQRARHHDLYGALRPVVGGQELPALPGFGVAGASVASGTRTALSEFRSKPRRFFPFWRSMLRCGTVERLIFGRVRVDVPTVFIENRRLAGGSTAILLRIDDLSTVADAVADARELVAAPVPRAREHRLTPGRTGLTIYLTARGDERGPVVSFMRRKPNGHDIGAPFNLDGPQLDALDKALGWLAGESK